MRYPKPGQTRFRVNVTDEDIARATRNESYKCVVAQAVARTIPDAARIEIDLQTVRFTRASTGERLLYLTPTIAAGYVVAFDAGEDIHPFSFNLSNPVQIQRRLRTKEGLEQEKARKEAKRKREEAEGKGKTGKDEPKPKAKAKVKKPKVAIGVDPRSAAEAMKEEYEQAKLTTTVSGTHPPRPRTYKTGKRAYGNRLLRVNRYLREDEEAQTPA